MKRVALALLMLTTAALPLAAQLKTNYGVTATADKGTDFTKFKTYVWQTGYDANDKRAHEQIVASVDRELKALGFEKKTSAPSDVIVKYGALRRVDVAVAPKTSATSRVDVGTLQVTMLDAGTGKEVFRAKIDTPIEMDPEKIAPTASEAVAALFAKYPTKTKK